MGVTGLWTVVAPTARPTQLATLNRKRLAVDASIWIYQFLKAVRDKEGNALRNSHVVGFFRRICKLLFFGIKPVFVFDGGAPLLKRETVRGRARRREGRREDAARTAGKLLGMQMQRAAEEEERKRKAERARTPDEEELPPAEELVYVDEIGMSNKERQQNRQFRRKDQYHLPDLDISIESMGAPNDPRIMSQAELEDYARQFHSGEDINLYDFSKIDFESPFFLSLPASDRYNILNAARLRSRLRMGYSKEQLDDMFPDRMAFSRFQIERVRERNELTQRLMHVNGMAEDFLDQGGRIAGEKGKEYVLVKNDGVEGGWALGVVSNKGGNESNAIDLDEEVKDEGEDDQEEEEEFEEIAIEGLNRIPRRWARNRKEVDYNPDYKDAAEEIAQKRRAVYEARQKAARPILNKVNSQPENEDLFVAQDNPQMSDNEADELFEDVNMDQDEDDLQRAIQMSLQKPEDIGSDPELGLMMHPNRRTDQGVAKKINLEVNHGRTANPPSYHEEEDEEGGFDLQAALAESRKSKHHPVSRADFKPSAGMTSEKKFAGPLPFESLNLGQSLLGKKKADKIEEDQAGGFEKEDDQKKKSAPLPSWFTTKVWSKGNGQMDKGDQGDDDHVTYGPEDVDRREVLMRRQTQEVIDVDDPSQPELQEKVVIDLSAQEDGAEGDGGASDGFFEQDTREFRHGEASIEQSSGFAHQPLAEVASDGLVMDGADIIQANPPESMVPNHIPELLASLGSKTLAVSDTGDQVDWSETDEEDVSRAKEREHESPQGENNMSETSQADLAPEDPKEAAEEVEEEFEDVDLQTAPTPSSLSRGDTSGMEDPNVAVVNRFLVAEGREDAQNDLSNPNSAKAVAVEDQEDFFSDSDEELMRQMAIEAEEHARFASALNHTRTPAEAVRGYEKELKQLRNQQKKDRRDADEVTQIMVQECQALLRLFGLPYITAPMEAEAQCAELVTLGLVDGIVTDDSDIFLFGGTRIYKNMFNAAKFVECYLTTDLEKEYALDRKKLIRFAHLLGSDYTEGIPGVGPVTALEILTEFDTLEEFRDWCSKIQMGQLEGNIITRFHKKFRKQAQRMFLPPAFPDTRVDQAYLHPEVDSDPSGFEWGVPDLDALRSFLMATIGWSQERTDEVLVPVIRDMNKRGVEGTQANITRFFGGGVGVGGKEAAAPRNRGVRSGRMEKAFGRLKNVADKRRAEVGEQDEAARSDAVDVSSSSTAHDRRRMRGKGSSNPSGAAFDKESEPSIDEDGGYGIDNTPRKKRRRKVAA